MINGIDYNAELDLLREWLFERINTDSVKPLDIIRYYQKYNIIPILKPDTFLSFDEWKQNKAYESFWNERNMNFYFPEKSYHHDNPMDGKWTKWMD